VVVIEGAVPSIPEILGAQLVPGGMVVAVLAAHGEDGGIGRAVVAKPSGGSFAVTWVFDCTARPLPVFTRPPAFSL
jgi:protein-L-isoaspartate(D-aspartate) O-methyltransferase